MLAIFELDHEVAVLGREVGAAVFPFRQDQAGDFREIGDLALEVGCLEGDVAEALGLDHDVLQISSVLVRGGISRSARSAHKTFKHRAMVGKTDLRCNSHDAIAGKGTIVPSQSLR